MNWFDSWALTLTILIPAVGAVIVILIPRTEEAAIKLVALLTTLATFAGASKSQVMPAATVPASTPSSLARCWVCLSASAAWSELDSSSLR